MGPVIWWESIRDGRLLYGLLYDKSQKLLKEKAIEVKAIVVVQPQSVTKHHAAARSLPSPLWYGGENRKSKRNCGLRKAQFVN